MSDNWTEPDWEHVRNMRLIAVSYRAHAKDAQYPDQREAYEGQAKWADDASNALERLILKTRELTPVPASR